jgi:hypothetical protein
MRCQRATQLSSGLITAIIPSQTRLVHSATLSALFLIWIQLDYGSTALQDEREPTSQTSSQLGHPCFTKSAVGCRIEQTRHARSSALLRPSPGAILAMSIRMRCVQNEQPSGWSWLIMRYIEAAVAARPIQLATVCHSLGSRDSSAC